MSPDLKAFETFHALPARPDEGQVVTAYKRLLATYFPEQSDFKIISRKKDPSAYQAVNQISVIDLEYASTPVLIILVSRPEHFVLHSARQAAEDEIRDLLEHAVARTDIPTLYGISAFGHSGTKYRVFKAEKIEQQNWDLSKKDCIVEPCPVSRDPHIYNSIPEDWWDNDIFDAQGQNRILGLVEYVQTECAKLSSKY